MKREGHDAVGAYYDQVAQNWDATHADRQNPIFRQRLHDCLQALLKPAEGGDLAIEMGAGTGPYISLTARMFRRVVCTDVSGAMLQVLEQRRDSLGLTNVEALREDAAELAAFPGGSADAVYSVGMFETIGEPASVFAAARRVLRPGGIFASITSNGSCPWYALRRHVEGAERAGHIVRYMKADEVRSLAAASGFEISTIDCWGLLPPGISNPFAARMLDTLGTVLQHTFMARRLGILAFRLTAKQSP